MIKDIAVIDIGTNSTRLLVGRVKNGKVKEKLRLTTITRIGEDFSKNNYIKGSALQRTLKTISYYLDRARECNVDKIYAFGTAAMREAGNSQEVLKEIEMRTGILPKVLSGEVEASTTFLGASSDFRQKQKTVIDIGGGSTELMVGKKRADKVISIPMGSVKVQEIHNLGDYVGKEHLENSINEVMNYFRASFKPSRFNSQIVISVGGTPTSLSAIIQGLEEYDRKKVHLSKISLKELKENLEILALKTRKEREKIPSMDPRRADVIVAGGVILFTLLTILGKNETYVSEHDILDGLLLRVY